MTLKNRIYKKIHNMKTTPASDDTPNSTVAGVEYSGNRMVTAVYDGVNGAYSFKVVPCTIVGNWKVMNTFEISIESLAGTTGTFLGARSAHQILVASPEASVEMSLSGSVPQVSDTGPAWEYDRSQRRFLAVTVVSINGDVATVTDSDGETSEVALSSLVPGDFSIYQ